MSILDGSGEGFFRRLQFLCTGVVRKLVCCSFQGSFEDPVSLMGPAGTEKSVKNIAPSRRKSIFEGVENKKQTKNEWTVHACAQKCAFGTRTLMQIIEKAPCFPTENAFVEVVENEKEHNLNRVLRDFCRIARLPENEEKR